MRLQTNQELLENKIKQINLKHNAEMFTTRIKGGFAAEQKIRELKKRIDKAKVVKKKLKKE